MRSTLITTFAVSAFAALLVPLNLTWLLLHLSTKQKAQNVSHNTSQKDNLVLVTVNVGEGYNQRVELEIRDDEENGNVYVTKKNVNGEIRNAFTTTSDGEVKICFANILDNGFQEGPGYKRPIEVKVSTGAETADFQKMANAEKLDPLELELRKLETVVKEIVDEMNYLKRREARLRDTNESTNDRVKWFSILSIFTLFSLGTWQILYLRRYFKRKRLID